MNINFVLFLLAAVCFALEAIRVKTPINLTAAGFCFITLALWIV